MTGSADVVAISGLEVGYRRRGATAPAVRGVDLTVGAGEIVALVGESGSGKTTIAATVAGLLPGTAVIGGGSVRVTGADGPVEVVGAPERVLRDLRGAVVGLVPQDPMVGLDPTMRIGAQVAGPVRLRGVRRPEVDADVLALLDRAGVDDPGLRARQYPHELSGGLRQRVLIAIALARRPRLIVADEPTSALDVTVQSRILDHLEGLVRGSGTALLLITHDLAVAADRSDRVVVLREGRVVEQGSPQTILVDPAHGYTRRLIAAAPGLAHRGRIVVRDRAPAATSPASGPAAAPVLALEAVGKDYPLPRGRAGTFPALHEVSLELAPGSTHALVGESGSGKTTTLRLALALERPSRGRVLLGGTDVTGLTWRRTRPLRRSAALVHQNPYAALDPRFTVAQTITEPLVSFRVGDRRTRAARARVLLDQVALPAAFSDRLPAELSGGQRQRVAIARALALEPRVVLLDEPVSALDVSVQDQILTLLARLQDELGLSYLVVSHDLGVVARIAHTVSVLRAGRVVEAGPVARVFGAPESGYTRELIAAIPGRRAESRV